MQALMITLSAAAAALAAAEGCAEELRDLKGPLPPSGAPPFALTAALLFLAAIYAGYRRYRGGRKPITTPSSSPPGSPVEAIDDLRERYLRGEVSEALLFDALSELLRGSLPLENHLCLTTAEALSAAGEMVPPERLRGAAALLELCDSVRFGNLPPQHKVALAALDDAAVALRDLRKR